MQATIIGIDIAKTVFQVCGVDAHRRVVLNRRLSRRQLEAFMLQWPASRVVMEACYMAHYWGRRFEAMGHWVQLIPAQHVKPFAREETGAETGDTHSSLLPMIPEPTLFMLTTR